MSEYLETRSLFFGCIHDATVLRTAQQHKVIPVKRGRCGVVRMQLQSKGKRSTERYS